jgi:hypothetical protein
MTEHNHEPAAAFRLKGGTYLPESLMSDDTGPIPVGGVAYLRVRVEGYARDYDGMRCAALVCVDRVGRVIDEPEARHYFCPEKYLISTEAASAAAAGGAA